MNPRARGAGWVLALATLALVPFLDLPLLEDDKFWWVPQALKVAEEGLHPVPAGALPHRLLDGAVGGLPDQWSGGLPDYGHPPLFFWYLGVVFRTFGYSLLSLHLSLLPLTWSALLGTSRLCRRLGASSGAAEMGMLLLLGTPLFFAQSLRADLDLPLVAVVPWALVALLEGRWGRFAALGVLASWIKEPGVLLVVPAGVAWLLIWAPQVNRTNAMSAWRTAAVQLGAASAPLLGLVAWAAWHHALTGWGLASPERLPDGGAGFLEDLAMASAFLLGAQGRFILVLGAAAPWVWARLRPRGEERARWLVLASFVGTVLVFFSTVGFFGASGRMGGATHLRYFLPALPALVALGVAGLGRFERHAGMSWLAGALILGLMDLRGVPVGGPERNLFGADVARARQEMAEGVRRRVLGGRRVWIGQAEAPDLQFPAVGGVAWGVEGLLRYGPETTEAELEVGDLVMVSAYGEPPGRLKARLAEAPVVQEARVGRAWVRLVEVRAAEVPQPPSPASPSEGAPSGPPSDPAPSGSPAR